MRQSVIKRRHQFDPLGPVCAIEYPLPCEGMPIRARKRLDPWLAECVGCCPVEARALLRKRWAELNPSRIGVVTRYFLRCLPCSILVNKDAAWLIVRGRSNKDFKNGREWFLPPPTPLQVVDSALDRFGVEKNEFVRAFFREFAGFREELPDVSGYFYRVQEWLSFGAYVEEFGWRTSNKTSRDWSRAAVIYVSLGGDVLLIDRNTHLAWWDHEIDEIRALFKDFRKLPARWLESIRVNWPFDGHGRA